MNALFDAVRENQLACVLARNGSGAFMSMIGSTLISEIINYQPHLSPAEILTLLNVRVTKALHQKQGELSSQDDGMDMALCSIDYAKNEIIFAGANLSLTTIIRDELKEIRGDVFPIGGVFAKKEIRFSNKTIPIQSGLMLYLYTDGYKDQFGGLKKEKSRIRARRSGATCRWRC